MKQSTSLILMQVYAQLQQIFEEAENLGILMDELEGTMINLEARIKELAKLAADSSREGVLLIKNGDRLQGHSLMRQAYDASKRCQVLIAELKRLEG